jgi:hypothetical protein
MEDLLVLSLQYLVSQEFLEEVEVLQQVVLLVLLL